MSENVEAQFCVVNFISEPSRLEMVQEMCTLQDAPTKYEMVAGDSGMNKLIDRVLDLVLRKLKEKSQPIPIKDTMIEFKTVISLY